MKKTYEELERELDETRAKYDQETIERAAAEYARDDLRAELARVMSDESVFGYSWADIQRAQRGGRLGIRIHPNAIEQARILVAALISDGEALEAAKAEAARIHDCNAEDL